MITKISEVKELSRLKSFLKLAPGSSQAWGWCEWVNAILSSCIYKETVILYATLPYQLTYTFADNEKSKLDHKASDRKGSWYQGSSY